VTRAPDLAGDADASLTAIGPLRVASSSRATVLGALVATLLALAALAVTLLLTARRLATLQQRQRQTR
jgi:hypothetical protein